MQLRCIACVTIGRSRVMTLSLNRRTSLLFDYCVSSRRESKALTCRFDSAHEPRTSNEFQRTQRFDRKSKNFSPQAVAWHVWPTVGRIKSCEVSQYDQQLGFPNIEPRISTSSSGTLRSILASLMATVSENSLNSASDFGREVASSVFPLASQSDGLRIMRMIRTLGWRVPALRCQRATMRKLSTVSRPSLPRRYCGQRKMQTAQVSWK